jgi:large subunit ribosomal protein L21
VNVLDSTEDVRSGEGDRSRVFGRSVTAMFAIVKTGGKQYRVAPGDQIVVERLQGDVGAEISLDYVLAIGDGESGAIGRPTLADAWVRARIVQQPRGTKIIVFKKKRRKNYRRKHGHRQELTVLRIEEIRQGVSDHQTEPELEGREGPTAPSDSEV